MRKNAGYTITSAIRVGDTEFVLGENMADPAQYVTWQCADGNNYYWGHYMTDQLDAVRDLLTRASDALESLAMRTRQAGDDLDADARWKSKYQTTFKHADEGDLDDMAAALAARRLVLYGAGILSEEDAITLMCRLNALDGKGLTAEEKALAACNLMRERGRRTVFDMGNDALAEAVMERAMEDICALSGGL